MRAQCTGWYVHMWQGWVGELICNSNVVTEVGKFNYLETFKPDFWVPHSCVFVKNDHLLHLLCNDFHILNCHLSSQSCDVWLAPKYLRNSRQRVSAWERGRGCSCSSVTTCRLYCLVLAFIADTHHHLAGVHEEKAAHQKVGLSLCLGA